jgi:hypothetical protein
VLGKPRKKYSAIHRLESEEKEVMSDIEVRAEFPHLSVDAPDNVEE